MQLTLRTPWVRRLLISSAVIAVLVGSYALAGFVGVPRWLRSGLQNYVSAHYHRQLSLGDIHFNPFTLTLDVRDISFPDADSTPMLGATGLHVQLQAASLWRRGPSFGEIVLTRPFARVLIRRDGSLNLADLAKPFAVAAPPTTPPKKSSPMRLFVDRLAVIDGRSTYEDQSRATPFQAELQPINFDLRGFSTVGNSSNEYVLDFATPVGERFHWSGTLAVAPVASRGQFQISAVRARTLWSFLSDALHFEVSSGVIALKGSYALTTGNNGDLQVDVHELTVNDLGVRPPGAQSDYVNLKLIDVRNTHVDLARRSLTVGTVRLAGGAVRAWINAGGTLNFSELMASSPATPASTAPAPSASPPAVSAPWSLAAPDIEISGLELSAEDREVTPAAALTLGDFALRLDGFHSPGDVTLKISSSATVNRSGRVDASATDALGSGAAHAQVALHNVDLTVLQPYVTERSAIQLKSGQLTTQLVIDRAADGGLTVAGDTEVAKLRTVDDQLRQDFVKWDRLTLRGMQYRSQPAALTIRRIVAVGPYARVIVRANRTLNITAALAPGAARAPGGPAAAPAAAVAPKAAAVAGHASSAMAMSIGTIQIVNGSARYTDLWIQPNFFLAIQSLSGSVVGLSSNPRSRAKVDLKGKVDRYAPISVSGEINPLAATAYSNMKLSFDGVQLTTATPYSARFAGYKIEKGTMSANITYHLENRALSADPHFTIDQLQLGDRVSSPDAVKLPLKLAVALLKDRHGVIDLDLPLSGSLNDPKFKLGPLIWKVLVNVLSKAATAPFALLGRLVGGGEQMKFIDFDAGAASLDASAQQKLAQIAKALQDRPSLKLDVPSAYTPGLDRPALVEELLEQKLAAQGQTEAASRKHRRGTVTAPAPDLSDPATRFRLLVAEYRSELGAKTALPAQADAVAKVKGKQKAAVPLEPAITELETALDARIQIPDGDLQLLGRHRARAIQDALLKGAQLDPARLFVLNTATTAADGKRVRFELGLE
ncbi:MAG: DUF748 domain-containing protein [Steroidobacteraceae bacterium]